MCIEFQVALRYFLVTGEGNVLKWGWMWGELGHMLWFWNILDYCGWFNPVLWETVLNTWVLVNLMAPCRQHFHFQISTCLRRYQKSYDKTVVKLQVPMYRRCCWRQLCLAAASAFCSLQVVFTRARWGHGRQFLIVGACCPLPLGPNCLQIEVSSFRTSTFGFRRSFVLDSWERSQVLTAHFN